MRNTDQQPLGKGVMASRRGAVLVKFGAAALVVGAAAVGGYAWWSSSQAKTQDSGKTSDLVPVEMLSFDITTLAIGDLAAKSKLEIRSELENRATITEIVKEASRVKKGDVLVRLNGSEIETNIDQEKLQVEEARAAVVAAENDLKNQEEENLSSLRKAELKVALAELTREQWELGDLDKKYVQLKLDIDRAQRDLERLEEKHQKSLELYAQEFLSKNELDLDEIAHIEAVSKLQTALLDEEIFWTYEYPKELRTKSSDVTEALAERDRVDRSNQIALVSKQAGLTGKREQLRLREDRLAKLEEQLEKCTILAPSDGLVVYSTSLEEYEWQMSSQGALQIGREVNPNDLLIILPDVTDMVAKVRVHEAIGGQIKEGMPAIIKIDALAGQTFTGAVESIGVMAETNWRDPNRREYTIQISLDKDAENVEKLKPSMRCEAQIRLGRVEGVAAVPVQAVFSEGPVRYVYTPSGTKFTRVPVRVGRRSDTYAEISAGLDPGSKVLVRTPAAGEVLASAWDAAQLQTVGLRLNEKGEPEAVRAPGGEGRRGGGRGGPPPAEGAPNGPAKPEENAKPAGETTGASTGEPPAPAQAPAATAAAPTGAP